MVLGLDRPASGERLGGDRRYAELRWPLGTVGALLDAKALRPGRSAASHLPAMPRMLS